MRAYLVKAKIPTATFEVKFTIPEESCLRLEYPGIFLGRIYDSDQTKLNGQAIGATGSPNQGIIRSGMTERIYLVPESLLSCRGENILTITYQAATKSKVGPLLNTFQVGEYDVVKQTAITNGVMATTGPAIIGLILLVLSPFFFFMFYKDEKRWPFYRILSALVAFSGLLCITLSGFLLDFTLPPSAMFRINISVVTSYCFVLVGFVQHVFYTKSTRIRRVNYLTLSILLLVATLYSPLSSLFDLYRIWLPAIFLYPTVLLICAMIRAKQNRDVRNVTVFLACIVILVGNWSDVLRLLGYHSQPNMSPWLIMPSIFIIGIRVVMDLQRIFLSAIKEEEHRRNSAIANMTHMLAHDIRNPFSMVKAFLGILNSSKDIESSQGMIKRFSPDIDRAINSVSGMLQDVLEVGSDTPPHKSDQDLVEVLKIAIVDICQLHPRSKVAFEFDLQHSSSISVNDTKILRVFSNIIDNAFEAMSLEGRIWISSRDIHSKNDSGFVELRIRNENSYIEPQDLDHLFDAFYTKNKKNGTGLGLAITKKIIEAHGGSVNCTSDQSSGTEFALMIPNGETGVKRESSPELPVSSTEVSGFANIY